MCSKIFSIEPSGRLLKHRCLGLGLLKGGAYSKGGGGLVETVFEGNKIVPSLSEK